MKPSIRGAAPLSAAAAGLLALMPWRNARR